MIHTRSAWRIQREADGSPFPRRIARAAFLSGFVVGVCWGRSAQFMETLTDTARRAWPATRPFPVRADLPRLKHMLDPWRLWRRSRANPERT